MRHVSDQTILQQLLALDEQLAGLSAEAQQAIEALTVHRSRNQAIGTLLPMQERLRLASQLVDVIVALHRLAPRDGQGGAS